MSAGEGEDLQNQLSRYVDALPAGGPPARDRSARRARVVPQLRTHAARVHTRTRRLRVARRVVLGLSATTSLAAAFLLVSAPRAPLGVASAATLAVLDGTLWLESGDARRAVRTGEAFGVDAGGALESPAAAETRVRLANTATLTLAPASRVGTVVAAATDVAGARGIEAVNLLRGRAHLKVTKLHAGQRFHVLTPDADVQVRGTEFDVELHPGAVPATCVRVQEGLVAVFANGETHLVKPGETWGCAPPVASAPPAPSVVPPSPPAKTRPQPAAVAASDLRAQNALFKAALKAERAGNTADAASLYQRLLERAPHGPLSEQARANLVGLDVGRAAQPR
jgi:hypothetical protein